MSSVKWNKNSLLLRFWIIALVISSKYRGFLNSDLDKHISLIMAMLQPCPYMNLNIQMTFFNWKMISAHDKKYDKIMIMKRKYSWQPRTITLLLPGVNHFYTFSFVCVAVLLAMLHAMPNIHYIYLSLYINRSILGNHTLLHLISLNSFLGGHALSACIRATTSLFLVTV